jgi:carbamoyltransferase
LLGTAAVLLRDGRVLGWMHGRIETGPRALGQRSILASPFVAGMRRRVSEGIKRRESFRPLGAACPIEYASHDFLGPGGPTPTMLFAWQAHREVQPMYGELLHRDGSVRLQTVDRIEAPVLHELLVEFGRMAPAPVLINTSLNPGGLPILNRLSDAIAMLDRDGLDALVDVDRLTIYFSRSQSASGVGVAD